MQDIANIFKEINKNKYSLYLKISVVFNFLVQHKLFFFTNILINIILVFKSNNNTATFIYLIRLIL